MPATSLRGELGRARSSTLRAGSPSKSRTNQPTSVRIT